MPATEAVQMIEPLPLAFITALACLMARNGPIRLTRSTSIQPSGVICSSGPNAPAAAPMPALA